MNNRAIDADGGEGADERSIAVKVDAFYDRFRLGKTIDDVPTVRGKYIQAMQGVYPASLRRRLRLGVAGRTEHHGEHADQCPYKK